MEKPNANKQTQHTECCHLPETDSADSVWYWCKPLKTLMSKCELTLGGWIFALGKFC